MEAYRVENVSFSYPLQERKALVGLDLAIRSGEFVTLCGQSGSGKSTLLRQFKTILTPHGKRDGMIYFQGEPLSSLEQRRQASEIGFVQQNPDNQLVTDKVWHELAFGLESLGCDQRTIRLRVAEMASFFGIQSWFHKRVAELSGGQKQLLNLAGVMAMQPSVLILDEPTSQLDPIAAQEFLDTLRRINRDLGTTIILSEHRLEEVLPLTERLIVMDQGRIIADAPPAQAGAALAEMNHPMFAAMPSAMQIARVVHPESGVVYPLTINEGRNWINKWMKDKAPAQLSDQSAVDASPVRSVVELRDVWFRYDKLAPDTIKDLSLTVKEGEWYCIVGGNGTGKTTALSLIGGTQLPYRGKVLVNGKDIQKQGLKERFHRNLGILPQNPQHLFLKKTVELDLLEMLADSELGKEERQHKVEDVILLAELESVRHMHPYDLSGGEQQRAALAKILLMEPRILLLDEPTKGLDAFFKVKLARLLSNLTRQGVTIVMVSHDIEFCARHADSCALFFDGSVVTTNRTRAFFAGNSFYTTAANRMARHFCPEAITTEDVARLCQSSH
ncbi:ABC transporter ATP-binding protein [Paenibacillus paeoniae]|uniref:ATP-binding cassette domain-containing protein n=1 Tax=Paenibacillus paeoniae TaxID=2292705 RepID=A0A371P5F1_9BACL|nr:ATP-binding cassette domain-containing protein [Paenibacillus paeoniae]REK71174.1 ATP-binding cassette domain-containing protein [Paenibacillus paeoniae]